MRYFHFVSSFPQLSTKKTLNKEMAFVCVLIRTQAKIIKPWYARSVVDRSITMQDLFASLLLENLTMEENTSIFDLRTPTYPWGRVIMYKESVQLEY